MDARTVEDVDYAENTYVDVRRPLVKEWIRRCGEAISGKEIPWFVVRSGIGLGLLEHVQVEICQILVRERRNETLAYLGMNAI
jgi:hypothetical protein